MKPFASLILPILMCPVVFSQTMTTGDVSGTTIDPSGRLVVNATVVLKSTDTGESRTVQSNASGAYRFTFLKPGRYEISATSVGLESDTGSLGVAVGQVEILDVILKPEEPKEVVLVTDAAPLLDSDNANIVYTLSSRQMDLLPLPGEDLVGVAYSMPGVVINNRFGQGNFASPGVGSVSNLFTVNGVDDNDPYFNVNNSGVSGLLLGANEVQEASVIQNAYQGQYGRQAGLQVNYVTKSGTNAYHGNLVHNYNGTLLNANDFFSNTTGTPRPHTVSNQYAASLGGRIVRDKLFFFVDTEALRVALPVARSTVAIPSAALEDYTLRTISPYQIGLYQKAFALYNNAPGHERGVAVTNGNGPFQDSTGRMGCGRLAGSPTGTGGTFGVDVSCAQAWETSISRQITEWLFSTRIDYNLSASQRMGFRFKTDHGFLPAFTSTISPVFDTDSRQPDYEGQLSHTWVITPQLVNNFIGAVTYNSYVFDFANLSSALNAFPLRFNVSDGGANGRGFAQLGTAASYPGGRRAGQLQIVDDLAYNVSAHSLKVGVNYRYNRESDLSNSAFTYVPRFNFVRLDEFADGALNGRSNSFYQQNFTTIPVLHIRLYNLGAYVQDQWAATPHLKVTATVRFDRTGNPYCPGGCFTRLAQPFDEIQHGLLIPYNQSIQTGLAHAFYSIEPLVPQPRISLAYSPAAWKNTVLRGGVGEFSDLYPAFFAGIMGGNAPSVFPVIVRSGLVNTAGPGSAPAIAAASAHAFQTQFAAGATLQQLQQSVAPATFAPPAYYSIPSTLRTPKYIEWSAEVQHQFGTKNVFTARYMGNHGYDIFTPNVNANASADPSVFPNGFVGLPAISPDPRFAAVTQLTNAGYSNYHALSIVFHRAFGRGLQGQTSYTWSHALDTLSNGGLSYFNIDSFSWQISPTSLRSLNYSNADYDVRHNITGDLIWEMPFESKNRFVSGFLSGWAIAGKLNAHTGLPFSAINTGGPALLSYGGFYVLADAADPNVRTSCGHSAVNTPCFTVDQFGPAGSQADLGNLPRNSFRGTHFFNIDSSVYKSLPIRERIRLVLGASAYNLMNHPNFFDPNSDIAGSGLGLIQSTAVNPSGPYGWQGGPSGRTVVVTGRFTF